MHDVVAARTGVFSLQPHQPVTSPPDVQHATANSRSLLRRTAVAPHVYRTVAAWSGRLTASIADQATMSLTNILANVILARSVSTTEYGGFAVAFSVLLLFTTVHSSLLLDPMTALGPRRYAQEGRAYVSHAIRAHVVLTLAAAVALAAPIAILKARGSLLALALVGVAAAIPMVLLLALLRRVCYLLRKPSLAAAASGVYGTALLTTTLLLRASGRLSAMTLFGAIAAAAAVASVVLWRNLRGRLAAPIGDDGTMPPRPMAHDHWRFGKWLLASGLLLWMCDSIYPPMLGAKVGLVEAGAFRAAQTLAFGMIQLTSAVQVLLTATAAVRRAEGHERFRSFCRKAFALMVLPGVAYAFLLSAVANHILVIVYGSQYASYGWLIYFFSAALVLETTRNAAVIVLLSAEHPETAFWIRAVAAALTLLVGSVALARFGLLGAVLTYTCTAALTSGVAVTAAYRLLRQPAFASRAA